MYNWLGCLLTARGSLGVSVFRKFGQGIPAVGLSSELFRHFYGTDLSVALAGNVWWADILSGCVKFDCWRLFEGH